MAWGISQGMNLEHKKGYNLNETPNHHGAQAHTLTHNHSPYREGINQISNNTYNTTTQTKGKIQTPNPGVLRQELHNDSPCTQYYKKRFNDEAEGVLADKWAKIMAQRGYVSVKVIQG